MCYLSHANKRSQSGQSRPLLQGLRRQGRVNVVQTRNNILKSRLYPKSVSVGSARINTIIIILDIMHGTGSVQTRFRNRISNHLGWRRYKQLI